jgi:hypothetical protein
VRCCPAALWEKGAETGTRGRGGEAGALATVRLHPTIPQGLPIPESTDRTEFSDVPRKDKAFDSWEPAPLPSRGSA